MMKHAHFENVHTSRVPGSFWPTKDAKPTLITTVCRVFSSCPFKWPEGALSRPKSTPSVFWGKVNWLGLARCLGEKLISEGHEWEIEAPLERQRLFGKVGKGRRYGRSPDGRVG